MANQEYVELLKSDVEQWNARRDGEFSFKPDLSGSDLSGADLSGANLTGAILIEANLSRAKLSGAILRETTLGNTNLKDARGLDACTHYGPSTLDHRTLAKSGRLPLPFLRGCGIPEKLIDYLPSLLEEAIQFYSCFISYSRKDQRFAERLYADLQNKGVRCWYAPEDLKPGDKFRTRIDEAIRHHDKVLLILSKNAIGSDWVQTEVEKALHLEQQRKAANVLFPIRLDKAVLETEAAWACDIRLSRHIGDFSRWKNPEVYTKVLDRLIRDLKASAI